MAIVNETKLKAGRSGVMYELPEMWTYVSC
jgi:hypothetical protein